MRAQSHKPSRQLLAASGLRIDNLREYFQAREIIGNLRATKKHFNI